MHAIAVIEGRGYLFSVEVLKEVREKYGLPGVLCGTLPQFPQQNVFQGLPLQLLPEEVEFLLSTGEFEAKIIGAERIRPRHAHYEVFRALVRQQMQVLPGLRFGCDFMAYPGDCMRYHSHYNVLAKDRDEEFQLLDLVSGGRLATSVKKCWVVGAPAANEGEEVPLFSIEWAGFG